MKNVFIIFLLIIIFALLYFIFTGKFCHCSKTKCPSYNNNKLEYIV